MATLCACNNNECVNVIFNYILKKPIKNQKTEVPQLLDDPLPFKIMYVNIIEILKMHGKGSS